MCVCDEGPQRSTYITRIIALMTHLDRDSDPNVDIETIQIDGIASLPYVLHIVEVCGLIPADICPHAHTYVHCQRLCEYIRIRILVDEHTYIHMRASPPVCVLSLSLSLSRVRTSCAPFVVIVENGIKSQREWCHERAAGPARR